MATPGLSDDTAGGDLNQNPDQGGVKGYIIEVSRRVLNDPGPLVVQMGDARYDSLWRDWCDEARNRQDVVRSPFIMGTPSEPGNQFKSIFKSMGITIRGKIVYCTSNTFRKGIQYLSKPLLTCALGSEEPFSIPRDIDASLDGWNSEPILSTDFGSKCRMPTDHDSQDIIHWQIRYFNPTLETKDLGTIYRKSKRQTVTVQQGSEKTCLQEKRVRITFRRLREARETFSIFVFTDEDTLPDTYKPDAGFGKLWHKYRYGIQDHDASPIAYFLHEICRVFKVCMDAWGKTLDIIDELVYIKLGDLDNVKRVEELMFDSSFNRSRDYFVALQILRIIEEWLDEARSTIQDMSKSPMIEGSRRYFDTAITYVNDQAATVQYRVRDKKEEINSLRDGLFNATSLRESTKAMALNQAIYVFTVVTVLFTPVSFLATFWALPFLNNPAEGTDVVPVPAAFRNSFIIMPILTYALVIGVAWFVGQRNSADALLNKLTVLTEIPGKLSRFTWNLLPKRPNKSNGRSPYP